MSYALDAAVIMMVLISAAVGYYRGFVRCAIKMLGTLVCVVLALIASELAAKPVYDNFIADKIESGLEERLKSYDFVSVVRKSFEESGVSLDLTDEQLKTALTDSGSIPAAVSRIAEQNGAGSESAQKLEEEMKDFLDNEFAFKTLERLGIDDAGELSKNLKLSDGMKYDIVRTMADGDSSAGAEYITSALIEPLALILLRCVLFIIILIIAESVLAIVFAIAGVFDKIPVANGLNRFFGLVCGLVKAAIYLALIGFACSAAVKAAGSAAGINKLNIEIIDKTYIFRYIFYLFYS